MDGLAQLLQAISEILAPVFRFAIWIWPLKVSWLHNGQRGVVTTFGCVRWWRPWHDREPGLVFYGPCEELHYGQASNIMADMVEQTVSFKDGWVGILNGSVVYSIYNCQRALLATHDINEIVKQASMNALRRWAADQERTAITEAEDVTDDLKPLVSRTLAQYGCRINRVFVSELRPDHTQMACDAAMSCIKSLQSY